MATVMNNPAGEGAASDVVCSQAVPVWGEVNPWPYCEDCERKVYRVGDTGEWRHFDWPKDVRWDRNGHETETH